MRRFLLTVVILSLGCTAQAHAGVSVRISLGGCGYGYQGGFCGEGYSFCYAGRSCAPFAYTGYGYGYPGAYFVGAPYVYATPVSTYDNLPPPAPALSPAPVLTSAPVQAPAPQIASDKAAPNPIPFGFDLGTRLIKSPWSGFVINGANKAPEQVIYDANTGQAFRIPAVP